MSVEHDHPSGEFAFTDQERLYDQISHERFMALLTDERTVVHHIEVSTNNYGEFLFVTMSQPAPRGPTFLTFWGLGFHESRERWLTDEWRWYETVQFLHQIPQQIAPDDAKAWIRERIDEITSQIRPSAPSRRAQLFALLADLTDEDGASTELEDLGIWDDEDLE